MFSPSPPLDALMFRRLWVAAVVVLVVVGLLPPGTAVVAQSEGGDTGEFGGFEDVREGVLAPWVNALAAQGVVEGTDCGDEAWFCPDEPILRSTMAVWVVRALGEEPSEASNPFADVDNEDLRMWTTKNGGHPL